MKKDKQNIEKDMFKKAKAEFKKHGGILHTSHAMQYGVHPSTLYAMRDSGILEIISRGVYRLSNSSPLSNPDLVIVATRSPSAVICLISSLSFHELTTLIPHKIHLALPKGTEEPRLKYPPINTYRFTGKAFTSGIKIYKIDNVDVRIYNPEKTLADCFKFRNKIGMDTAIEALRSYRETKKVKVNDILNYASICRVKKVMQPYLEAIL